MSKGPLEGVHVVELCSWLTGPMASCILADQGADVIKVEPPAGDPYRMSGTRRGGQSASFMAANRNKRSITLDIKQPEQKEILLELIGRSDVFIQNARPGAMDRLGLGAERLRSDYPRLICASISGFGQTGPFAGDGAYDMVIQALSGIVSLHADREGRPQLVRSLIADKLAPSIVAQAITAALFQRERTGRGATVDYAMLDGMVWWMWPDAMIQETFVGNGVEVATPVSAVDMVYRTDDGFLVCSPHEDKDWARFIEVVGRPELADNPLLATARGRRTNLHEYTKALHESFGGRTTAQWCALLRAEGIPCAPVLAPAEVLSHPQLIWNGTIEEVEHPTAGRYRSVRSPVRYDGRAYGMHRPAPAQGEHGEEVLNELRAPRPSPARS
jgi:crotonobetainyl-CoA:carnitine CoA-transferase CaiB-like acyl-CoA transferase